MKDGISLSPVFLRNVYTGPAHAGPAAGQANSTEEEAGKSQGKVDTRTEKGHNPLGRRGRQRWLETGLPEELDFRFSVSEICSGARCCPWCQGRKTQTQRTVCGQAGQGGEGSNLIYMARMEVTQGLRFWELASPVGKRH